MSATNVWAKADILVFAAASMKNALEVAGEKFEKKCKCKLVFSFAGSGLLARQIEAGAPADIYISADLKWMNWLIGKEVISAGTQIVIAENRLIVAVGREREIRERASLADALGRGRIAMANPFSVPAGRYGKAALEAEGLFDKIGGQLVYGENVRISLALAARGDVDSAIVYQSDLLVEPRVKMAYLFDKDTHAPIVYPAAQVRESYKGGEFLQFLQTESAQQIFVKFGFTVPGND